MNYKSFFLVLLLVVPVLSSHSQSTCEPFTLRVEAVSGSLLFCPETVSTESFRALASYESDTIVYDKDKFIYYWNFDGTIYHDSIISHTFDGTGAYPFSLRVEDPENGCAITITEVVKVGTIPNFNSTISTLEVACAKEVFSLVGNANTTTWTGFPTSVIETINIPKPNQSAYSSSLEFDVFDNDQVIVTEMDFDRICLIVDHVDFGQLQFELECPNGNTILLKSHSEGGANLGEPVVWDTVTPGRGYQYCFSPLPEFGTMAVTTPEYHAYTDMAGNYYFNAAYLPAGSYTPSQSLGNLTGCPLNGRWTIRVFDNQYGNNGFIHGWSLFFDESFYPDSLIFTPEIVHEQWYENSTMISGNPAQQSKNNEGEYSFRFEVRDNFGCLYDTTLSVTILPLPRAEIVSDLEMPVCEGDSSFLRVFPVSGSDFDWVYQWMLGGVDLPGRIFDTIMAKEPATYSLMVLDTLTGCQDIFNFSFTDQNCELTIPNVFTPNADGINDVFEILNLEHYPVAQIVIYNRWGKKVYEHTDYYNNWWDGQGHPDGVYFYVIKYERMGEVRYAQGSVTIIR
jgi:gliding motility-associated-like protein